ncbi:hypothetical protein ACEPAF_7645 [Sanghuangporus sanghuang]
MNFFDYELSRTATATPPQTAGESSNTIEPSLNDEVSQVVGQLGKLWGGFRKQSQVAFETARRDFSSVVAQAQKEIEKLTTDATSAQTTNTESTTTSTSSQDPDTFSSEKATSSSLPAEGDEATPQPSSPSSTSSGSFQFQTLLSRVQSSFPPNISATLERTIPAALKDPASHAYADVQHLRETLGSEFTRVQGVTRAQAEEYVHRSETLLREAGAYLKDAVRIIPPDEDGSEPDVVFDGMGAGVVVMPPSLRSTASSRAKGKGRETSAQTQQRIAGSRAAAMLSKLKRDPEALKKDPLEEEGARELYEAWLGAEVSSKDGGIESSEWTGRIKEALKVEDGEVLSKTRDALVPSALDSATFWTRYFFRVYQIGKDEEKRKTLLAGSGDEGNEEDFSWEDDDDESITPSEPVGPRKDSTPTAPARGLLEAEHGSRDTLQPGGNGVTPLSYPESLVTSPSNTSPRESSDGYDVVSPSSSSEAKAGARGLKVAKDTKSNARAEPGKKEEEDGDSDWE